MTLRFPEGFRWGVSTSSYQIEGGAADDGRGASIWDIYCATPGRVTNGDTGTVACDHYHRWAEDLDLIRDLGAQQYRFSIMWGRVLPEGAGRINQTGLDFYDRLVDGMLERGLEPWPCLYHWDLPQALQDQGGWVNRNSADWFADYAALMVRRLGDRARAWVTFNEPSVCAWVGNEEGRHAPGLTDPRAAVRVAHHLNLAHGRAVQVVRDLAPGVPVGFVLPVHKGRPLPQFAERDQHLVSLFEDKWNGVFLGPVHHGRYPDSVLDRFAPHIRAGDMDEIHRPVDFQGVNHYFPTYLSPAEGAAWPFRIVEPPKYLRRTEMNWGIDGHAFYEILDGLRRDYGNPPVFVTENGAAFLDIPDPDGRIDDQDRIAYYRDYLAGMHRAIREGANVQGYMPWSLLDNFEWAHGYNKRFGLVHVDYRTLKRTPKASFDFMRRVMHENEVPPAGDCP